MSPDGLFRISTDGNLVSIMVTPYDAEDLLQALLETHPDLLAGGQMIPESRRGCSEELGQARHIIADVADLFPRPRDSI